jgi:hypothetical protein
LKIALELSETARRLTLDGIRRRKPRLDEEAIVREYIALVHRVDLRDT